MAPSGPTVAISCRGRLTIAKYWGKSFVTIWITFRGCGWSPFACKSAARPGGCGLLLRKEPWWKGEEEEWWFNREPDLELLPSKSFLGTGLELEVEVVVEDMEAVLSSMNSCNTLYNWLESSETTYIFRSPTLVRGKMEFLKYFLRAQVSKFSKLLPALTRRTSLTKKSESCKNCTLSVLSSSFSCTCCVHLPLEAESHLRTTTSRSPSRKEATWGTSIKTGPRNLDPRGPTCNNLHARPEKERKSILVIFRKIVQYLLLRKTMYRFNRAERRSMLGYASFENVFYYSPSPSLSVGGCNKAFSRMYRQVIRIGWGAVLGGIIT